MILLNVIGLASCHISFIVFVLLHVPMLISIQLLNLREARGLSWASVHISIFQ